MLKPNIVKALNEQMTAELQSSYEYMSMAAYCTSHTLNGFAHWLQLQAQEELGHAMKIYKYLNDTGSKVVFGAIQAPKTTFESMLEVFEAALANEVKLSVMLDALASFTQAEKDNTTFVFLQWFLTEQVEEVASCNDIVEQLKMAKDSPAAMFTLDKEMAGRTLVGA